MTVYFFYGQEDYFIYKEVKKLKDKIDKTYLSINYKYMDNPKPEEFVSVCQNSFSMFGSTLTVIKINKYLISTGKDSLGLTDEQLYNFENALKNADNPNTDIILICLLPRDDDKKKPDARKKIYKIITNNSNPKEFKQFKEYEQGLKTEITNIGKQNGLSFPSQIVEHIISQLGVNLTLINSEIEKLAVSVAPVKTPTIDDIKKYCISSDFIFQLVDLLICNQKDELIKQYNILMEKKHPLEILGLLQGSLQRYLVIKTSMKKKSATELAKELFLPEFVIKKIISKLAKVPLKDMIEIKNHLTETEFKMKTGENVSPELALELTLLR